MQDTSISSIRNGEERKKLVNILCEYKWLMINFIIFSRYCHYQPINPLVIAKIKQSAYFTKQLIFFPCHSSAFLPIFASDGYQAHTIFSASLSWILIIPFSGEGVSLIRSAEQGGSEEWLEGSWLQEQWVLCSKEWLSSSEWHC